MRSKVLPGIIAALGRRSDYGFLIDSQKNMKVFQNRED